MIKRSIIPVYATVFAVAFLIVHRMGRMFSSDTEVSLVLRALPLVALAYVCYRTVKEEGVWLFLFPLMSAFIFLRKYYSVDSFEGVWLFAQLSVVLSSLWWFVTRLVEQKRNEKVFGLASIEKVKLLDPMSTAVALYGSPKEQEPADGNSEATTYTFSVGDFHEAVITEWKGEIHSIVYWSEFSIPGPDLNNMLDHYSDGFGWVEIEKGYWHQRKCDTVRLWCSIAPAIGVGTIEFMTSKSYDDED